MRKRRADKIREILEAMAGWDPDTLLSWAKDAREKDLSSLSDEDLDAVYGQDVRGR